MTDSPADDLHPDQREILQGHRASQVSWYCRVFRTEFGPMPFATICEMVEAEVLGPEDQVRSSDRCYWQAACRLTALRPLLTSIERTAPDSA